jgi:hypothetical protein
VLRRYASAFLVATVAALVVDAALQLALAAVRVPGSGGSAPWWVTANLAERGRWVAFAALLWWLIPRFAAPAAETSDASMPPPPAGPWHEVANAVLVIPLLWIGATWATSAIRFTLLGSWAADGHVFLAPDYYRGLLVELTPWALASAVVRAVARHAS